jgi:CPA1 family monovalent cation:H+ antiporter
MQDSIQLVVILLAICLAGLLSQKVRLLPPVSFIIAGFFISFLPAIEGFKIPPEFILAIILPPILNEAAFFTSYRDFKQNIRPIIQLAVGLVIVTSIAVAYVFQAFVPDATLMLGLLLGAIISPPDAVAATSVMKQVKVPKRVVSIVEGESLVNDATGLMLYKLALIAVTTATFSVEEASVEFIFMALGGIAVGLAHGFLFIKIFPKFKDESIAIISTFIPPYAAYLIAESMHVSGVLAVVTCGLYAGWKSPKIFTPQFRIPAEAVWRFVVFILNALVFILIGMQIPNLYFSLYNYETSWLISLVLAVCLTAVVVRFIYVFAVAYGTRFFLPHIRKKDPYPPVKNVFLVSWVGMRGIVTLATALALPISVSGGEGFLYRDLIIFIAVCVILFTLVLQGLTMPWVIKKLKLSHDYTFTNELWNARKKAADAAIEKLNQLKNNDNLHQEALSRITSHYNDRIISLGDGPFTAIGDEPYIHPILESENYLWQQALKAERDIILKLRKSFQISDEVMHEVLRELDLLSSRFK